LQVPLTCLGACLLGKPNTGKRTLAKWLWQQHRLKLLSVPDLVKDSLAASERYDHAAKKLEKGKKPPPMTAAEQLGAKVYTNLLRIYGP
jgi:adenylate kinase family enzyme